MITDRSASTEDHKVNKKKSKYNSHEVDNGILDSLEAILKTLEDQSESKDFNDIIQFFRKGFSSQIIQSWSYYAETNNHYKFAQSTNMLYRTLLVLNSDASLIEFGNSMIKLFLSSYTKVFYRGINNSRRQITIPILKLMKEMILFDNSRHIEDFIAYFDLSLSGIPRILTPTKSELEGLRDKKERQDKSIRCFFLEFWMILIKGTPSLLRKDLLTSNFKIMGAWFKYMDKVDSVETVQETMTVFVDNILKEKLFKKMTKTKILNELALSKIHSFYNSQNKELVKKVNDFFVLYGSVPETSVAFPDSCVWYKESPESHVNTGALVKINQKEFQIHNKLLFNMLRMFKPWEDDMQSSTVIKVLAAVPELVAPYCTYLSSLGPHDPRVTSYWIGSTLLLGRIIRLDIPEFMEKIDVDIVPSRDLVIENIFPSILTKSALTKCLQHESLLIRQLCCQLIIFGFQKFEKVLALYDRKGWISAKAILSNSFLENLPDLNVFATALAQVHENNKENKILPLSITMILKYFSTSFPNYFSVTLPSSNIYIDIMQMDSLSGLNLAMLDNFLQFQEFNDSQSKWWNSSKGDNSLFSSLLKFASSSNSSNVTSFKISTLLDRLLHGTAIFSSDLTASPIMAIINSLQVIMSMTTEEEPVDLKCLWDLLDQSISRCIRAPYKYVDMAQNFENISPFIMVIAEQWKYVEKKAGEPFDLLSKWICIFLRNMHIIGEPYRSIKKLFSEFLEGVSKEDIEASLNFEEFENSTMNNEEPLLNSIVASSFFQFITKLPFQKMSTVSRVPVNELDLAGLLFRLVASLEDQSISFTKEFKTSIIELLSKVAVYSLSQESPTFMIPRIYKDIFRNVDGSDNLIDQKSTFVAQNLMYVYKDVYKTIDKDVEAFLFNWLLERKEKGHLFDHNLVSSVCGCLNESHVMKLLESKFPFTQETLVSIFTQLFEGNREGTVAFDLFQDFINESSEDLIVCLGRFIDTERVSSFKSETFLAGVVKDKRYIPLLESYFRSPYFELNSVLEFLEVIKETNISILTATKISSVLTNDSERIKTFVSVVVRNCFESYKTFSDSTFALCIELFCTHGKELLTHDEVESFSMFITTEYEGKFSAPVIRFIRLMGSLESEHIKKWLNKMTLYITRIFSERIELSKRHLAILSEFRELIEEQNVCQIVNKNILNSQLEVVANGPWVKDQNVLNHFLLLLLAAEPTSVHSDNILQCLLNNEDNVLNRLESDSHLRFLTGSLTFTLFYMDIKSNSNSVIQKKLMTFYNGSISAEDRMILKILETIESQISISWTNYIYTWDFLESGEDEMSDFIGDIKLLTQEKEGYILSLSKCGIENSITNYKLERPHLPNLEESTSCVGRCKLFENYYKESCRLSPNEALKTIYDPLFIILLVIHNKELVKPLKEEDSSIKYVFDVKKLVTSGLFQFIVCALSDDNSDITSVASTLLNQMLISLEDNHSFKDGSIFKVLLKKIELTIMKNENNETTIPPLIWLFTSKIVALLLQPSSPLYEKAFRWVLSKPSLYHNDIPMLQELTAQMNKDPNYENYYSQLSWVLDGLAGIRTKADVDLLKSKGIIEWLFNLLNLPYLNSRMRSAIKSIYFILQRIEGGGSSLITRYGAIADLELRGIATMNSLGEASLNLERNVNGMNTKRKLLLEQEMLNNEELLNSYVDIINSQKRLRKWCEDDTVGITKRIRR
ncbi:hypothetical protein KAFR_0A00200 [Kazachstania africana CBS 2517]|uniref:Nucleolar pre-ribosomal-associated protein 1 n=1 Tax=Kazachstania africana (strain ATCC 22294 / BCRC 22015 / CBS 2517 / CECT 1963 / NBRC 1671 / NRRL Y-8276) TaxID=1071382 RepID=H2AM58_KAZAF|nr:hypothetical protein KAFR_0A00200 [Kazachstania africana CBS 2517]CCF55458.1 hypothetical protein KAFR_0A00200 [Kazachstania africana CBS 2517]